jgi:hypothetical protein
MLTKFLLSVCAAMAFFFATERCEAALNQELKSQIANACKTKAEKKPEVKNSGALCECIAGKHFDSAAKEPDVKEAQKQLSWVLDYYRAKNQKAAKALTEKLEYMADFDLSVTEECSETAHSDSK